MTDQEQAEALYQQGNQYRKQSDWQHALPSSPAVKAKEMVDNILAYYCKAMFNP